MEYLLYTMLVGAGIVIGICYCQWKEKKEYKKWQYDQPQVPSWLKHQAF